MRAAPCKECQNHSEGCHGTCEEYITWEKEKNERRRQINRARAHINMLEKQKRATIDKCKRYRK